MNYVVARIDGGLGNQLFQYALGRHLAEKIGADLLLDMRGYATSRRPYVLREFLLGPHREIRDNKEVDALRYLDTTSPLRRRLTSYLHPSISFRQEHRSELFAFQPRALNPAEKPYIYLDGYWQHEKYFLPIRGQLESEIRLRKVGDNYATLLSQIHNSHSIGIHFRHGPDQIRKTIYGVPPLDYYHDAISRIGLRPDTHIFIFSDNMPWVQENFKPTAKVTYVSGSYAVSDQEEFELLRSCQNIICANSTFSWWAAWLNGGREGKLIAPSHWYADNALDAQTKRGGLIPYSWTRI